MQGDSMTKLMVIPSHTNIDELIDKADAFLFGYQGMSVNFLVTVDLEYIQNLYSKLKAKGKQLFIALNKNFHNNELSVVQEIMKKLADIKIDGILYYDVALVQIKRENNIDIPLIWGAEHLTTNYATMNYWHQFGVDFVYVSGEITKKEIIEIRNHTQMKMIVPLFGHLPMFVSERHEIKNYLTHFHLNNQSSIYYMEKEGKRYPVIDNKEGTFVYSNFILNGYQEYLEFKNAGIDYALLNENFIEQNTFSKIVDIFQKENGSDTEIDELCQNKTDKGFLYKETVYQVKHYE